MNKGSSKQLYAHNNLAGCVLQRTQEITGVLVGLYHAEQAGIDAGDRPWATVCERHATMAIHRTKKSAHDALSLIEWCEACQTTDTMKFAHAIARLRQATYQALFLVGRNRHHALQLARSWSSIGRAGVFFSTGDQADCFDPGGYLIKPIEWYWQGDQLLVTKTLEDVELNTMITCRKEQGQGLCILTVMPSRKER